MVACACCGLLATNLAFAGDGEATEFVGGKGGGKLLEVPSPHQTLTGFDVTYGEMGASRVIRSVQAIYDQQGTQVRGKTYGSANPEHVRVEAKPGYAIGAIIARGGYRVDGFRAVFMRIKGDQLDPSESYESRWLGGRGGSADVKLGGDRRRVIGIAGRYGDDIDALGLMLND